MRYTKQQQETIKIMKEYMKTIRQLKRERFHLMEEYNQLPSISSPTLEENKGTPISQITRMNDYTQRRELLLKRIEIFNQYIDQFMLYTLLLSTRQRQMINAYMNTLSYAEMVEQLENKYYISISTYKRELPEICLSLSHICHHIEIPTFDKINDEFYQKCVKDMI
ncbi:MAG: hypothetical protein HFF36_11290 [Coprobacillus sp.]|nr:hypothetical protein [Coprobacillus sp.]